MKRLQRGGALLITMGVLASLVAILVAAAATQQVGLRASLNRMTARRARLSADAGIQNALSTLANQDPNQTTQQDDWYASVGQTGATRFVIGNDSFRFQIVDAASLINLNTAPEDQLNRLPLTQDQIDSLLDWREAGTTPRPNGGKDEYYNQLATPYTAKLRTLSTIDELLLIKGFTARALYEPQTDTVSTAQQLPTKADGTQPTLYDLSTVDSVSTRGAQPLPNINTVTNPQQLIAQGVPPQIAAQIVAQRAQLTTYRALLNLVGGNAQVARTLVNSYSVGGGNTLTGKINVNTASEAVLDTIPNMPPDVASSIVSRQSTGLTQLGDLFDVPGFSVQTAQDSLDLLSTNSQMFIIRVVGTAGTSHVSIEALVSISANGVQVLKVTQLPYPDMSSRWGWDATTSQETVLVEATQQ